MSDWRNIDDYLVSQGIRIGPPRSCQTDGGPYPTCGHAKGSYHYVGLARDYGDVDSDCRAVLNALLPFSHDGTLLELFYAPTDTWMKNGQQLSRAAIGDHDNHVHAAIDPNKRFGPLPQPAPPPPPDYSMLVLDMENN